MAAVMSFREQLQPILMNPGGPHFGASSRQQQKALKRDSSSTSIGSASTASHQYHSATNTTRSSSQYSGSVSSSNMPSATDITSPISANTPRRIRFAPLPDISRLSDSADGEEMLTDELKAQDNDFSGAEPLSDNPPRHVFLCNIEGCSGCGAAASSSSSSGSSLVMESPLLTTPTPFNTRVITPPPPPVRTASSSSSATSSITSSRAYAVPPSPRSPIISTKNTPTKDTLAKPKRTSIFNFRSSSKRRHSSPAPQRQRTSSVHNENDDEDTATVASVDTKNGDNDSISRFPFSTEEILTLGTINLFRAASNAGGGGGGGTGIPVSRTMSVQSTASAKSRRRKSKLLPSFFSSSNSSPKSAKADGNALSRSVSLGNGGVSNNALARTTSLGNGGNGLSMPLSTANVRKGTRMLNGRVYGGRRAQTSPNANPFANARDEADPAFVEWGYGGMGSVRSAAEVGGGAVWGRLQSEESGVFGGTAPVANEALTGEKEPPDDGSGMAWIKRRREQREKEKAEREAKEKAAAAESPDAKAEATTTTSTPTEDKTAEKDEITGPPDVSEKPAVEDVPEDTPNPTIEINATTELEDSVAGLKSGTTTPRPGFSSRLSSFATITPTTASAPSSPPSAMLKRSTSRSSQHYARTPSMSRSASGTQVVAEEAAVDQEHDTRAVTVPAPLHRLTHKSAGSVASAAAMADASDRKGSEDSGSEMDEEEEEEEEGERDDEDDEDYEEDDDEDDEKAESRRKTALGAGVEKISRHKEQQLPQAEETS